MVVRGKYCKLNQGYSMISLSSEKQLQQENTFAAVGKAFSALPCDYSVLPVAAETVDNYQNTGEGERGLRGERGGWKVGCMHHVKTNIISEHISTCSLEHPVTISS